MAQRISYRLKMMGKCCNLQVVNNMWLSKKGVQIFGLTFLATWMASCTVEVAPIDPEDPSQGGIVDSYTDQQSYIYDELSWSESATTPNGCMLEVDNGLDIRIAKFDDPNYVLIQVESDYPLSDGDSLIVYADDQMAMSVHPNAISINKIRTFLRLQRNGTVSAELSSDRGYATDCVQVATSQSADEPKAVYHNNDPEYRVKVEDGNQLHFLIKNATAYEGHVAWLTFTETTEDTNPVSGHDPISTVDVFATTKVSMHPYVSFTSEEPLNNLHLQAWSNEDTRLVDELIYVIDDNQDDEASPQVSRFQVSDFTAKYFDNGRFVVQETVPMPGIQYSYSDFHHINSYDFSAVWTGTLHNPTTVHQAIDINFDVSWSDVELFINGSLVDRWSDSNESFMYNLPPGDSSVEIRYENNWHTVGFNTTFTGHQAISKDEVAETLPVIHDEDRVVYIGAYESDDLYNRAVITLAHSVKPVVLFISSYAAMNWRIENPDSVEIKAIVYGALSSRSGVSGDIDDVPVLEVDDMDYSYRGYDYGVAMDIKHMTGGRNASSFLGDYAIDDVLIRSTD